MIVPTMTSDEQVKELISELSDVMRVCDAKQKKADRIIRTSVLFPVYLHTWHTTRKKNRWLILWEAKSRKNTGDLSLVTTVCVVNTSKGRYALMPCMIADRRIVMLFTPHFFQRFSLRAEINLDGEDLIRRYFERNPSYGIETEDDFVDGKHYVTRATCTTSEGAALGVQAICNECIYLIMKTFITYDMCKGEQVKKFAESETVRKEIHEEMINIF